MRLYRLRCFRCGGKFKYGNDVFRDSDNYPICKNCLREKLNETWDYDYTDYILETMEKDHNRNYNKWKKWFHENHVSCDGEDHDDYSFYFEHKDNITVIDGKNYCQSCYEEMAEFIEISLKEVV